MPFAGFPASGFAFLRQLKKNNDRDWFREHKDEYAAKVEEPMKALVLEISAECQRAGLPLRAKERSPVMRVYRDIRFSKDKSPYKTHVSAELPGLGSPEGLVGLYIHLSPEESFLGTGMWQPDRHLLLAWRQAMADDPKAFLKLMERVEKAGCSMISDGSLTKLPRGFQQFANEPFAEWLKRTSLVAHRPVNPAECAEAGFVKTVVTFAKATQPLRDYVVEVGKKAVPARKRLREEEVV